MKFRDTITDVRSGNRNQIQLTLPHFYLFPYALRWKESQYYVFQNLRGKKRTLDSHIFPKIQVASNEKCTISTIVNWHSISCHFMPKGMKNHAIKWCHKLCTFLFEATFFIWKDVIPSLLPTVVRFVSSARWNMYVL